MIEFEQDYEWGVCDSSFTEISDGSDSDITSDNYCYLVQGFNYDPASGGGGCLGIGGSVYSNHDCAAQHEQKHRDDYMDARDDLLAMIEASGDLSLPIACGDPNSSETCQGADSMRCEPLGYAIADEMQDIYEELSAATGEERARRAAQACFASLADSICTRASSEGWLSCPYCTP